MVTSRYTMDARNPAARREIAALADLTGAVRLPSGAHQQAAGTKVITDLLIFRRREPGRDPDPTAWEQTRTAELDGVQVPVNEYFLGNPGAVLGEMRVTRGAYSAEDLVVAASGDTDRGPGPRPGPHRRRRARPAAWPGPPHRTRPARRRPGRGPGTRTATWKHTATAPSPRSPGGTPSRSRSPAARPASCGTCSALRDAVTGLLDAEAASRDDTPELEPCAATSTARYDAYVRAYGTVNRFSWRHTGRPDPDTGEEKLARIRPPQGGFRPDPFAPARPGAGGIRPGQPARRQSRHLHPPRRGPPQPAPGRRHPCRRAGHLPGRLRRGPAGRDRPPARHRRGPGPRELGTLVFDDPGTGQLVAGRGVPVRQRPRQAERPPSGPPPNDPRFAVNAEELRQGHPGRPDAGRDRCPARRGLDRRLRTSGSSSARPSTTRA